MPKFVNITISPAQKTPASIIGKAYQKRIPNKKAAAEPVHTPVPGTGIATKINKKKAPYFSYLYLYLSVLRNNQEKKQLKIDHLLKNSETVFK